MSLINKKHIDNDGIIGFWHIDEDFDTLYSMVSLNEEEKNILHNFKNHKRKLEWLSVRALAVELTGNKDIRITYNGQKKPFLSDRSHQISISHSKQLTSILLSKNKNVGIDLEYMSKKINNIAFKFINENEQITSNPELKRLHLYIHWCAKEAIYKICDKQDINFKHNITITHFEPREKGEIEITLDNIHGIEKFSVQYEKKDNYVIAWCIR